MTVTVAQAIADFDADPSSGPFVVSDTFANVVANLDALQTITAAADLTSIALTDGGTPSSIIQEPQIVSDAETLSLITSPYSIIPRGTMSAADAIGLPSSVTSHFSQGIAVLDSAANVAVNLDALQTLLTASPFNGLPNSVELSDSGTPSLTITETQLLNDVTAIRTIFPSCNLSVTDVAAADALSVGNTTYQSIVTGNTGDTETVSQISVSDSAANISSALDALNGNGKVNNILVSNNAALIISASQAVIDVVALGELHNHNGSHPVLDIADTVADVSQNIDALRTTANIGAVRFTNGGTPTLTISQTQATSDAELIGKIVGPYDLHVTGVTGHTYTSYTNFYNKSDVFTLMTDFNSDKSITDIAHTSGLTLTGTNRADIFDIVGGHGDTINGGVGADHFDFSSVAESNSTGFDTIDGFNASNEKFDFSAMNLHVTGINAAVSGKLSSSSFNANLTAAIDSKHLSSHHAVLFTATSGTLAGEIFLIVDANGHAGYQAGHDLVFDISGATHLASLSISNFI